MKTDVTSMFFNSAIEGKTATPAWGTSIGQSKLRECRIDDFKPEVVNMLIGMTYRAVSDMSKLDVSKGSSKREIVLCSVFTDIYINEVKINNSQFVLLLVREHSESHDGRLIVSYAPYISYNNVSNQLCIDNMRKSIHCNEHGCWFVYDISIKNQSQLHFKAVVVDANNPKNYDKSTTSQFRSSEWNALIPEDGDKTIFVPKPYFESVTLQQIFYGAPGTGKSHAVKKETEAWEKRGRVVRTTFHPDSDYSTFVGAYKPTTESVQRYDIYNKPMTRDEVPVMEQIITYEFVEQAFLQAYIDAWKNRDEPEFLIIEEINRGNCAQIFGDLFQLLDRGNDGYSEYTIRADKDLQKHLCKAFEDVEIADYPNVKTGKELLLPGNLYIRATMNTSDQSLFPIDSAFKRRWDWKYVPIAKGNDNGTELNWMIEVDGDLYDWWTFVRTINKHVFDTTNSEDKQLGFFFCKAMDNIISAETFVCKVILYLWNDVFKDFGFDDKIFEDKEDTENPKLSFDKFYMANGKVNSEKIKIFLSNLGINTSIDRNKDNENGDGDMSTKVSFMINGNKVRYINQVCHTVIEEYVKSNKGLVVQDIIDYWSEYTRYNQSSWIIGNQTKYESLSEADKKKTYLIKTDNNESLWVNKNGWVYQDGPGDIRKFIKAVNDAEIGIKIEENRE